MSMMLPKLLLLLTVMGLTLLSPGLMIVGRWRLSPLEKLCAAVGASFVLVYLFQFLLFVTNAPAWASWFGTGMSAVLLAAQWRRLGGLMRHRATRQAAVMLAVVLLWAALLLCLPTHFGGGMWAGDWIEHYERTRYFLHQLPRDYQFIGMYPLPSRPPLQHVVTSFYLNQFGSDFATFQVVFGVLAAMCVLPCMLLMGLLIRRAHVRLLTAAAVFITSPYVAHEIAWTWPKMLAGWMTVMGTAFYLRAWRKDDALRMTLAFVWLSTGVLAHYLAGPFAVSIAAHYAVMTLLRRRWAVREWLVTTAVNVAILGTWIGYATAVYGLHTTTSSNTTVDGYKQLNDPYMVMLCQVYYTFVPPFVRGVGAPYSVAGTWSIVRDHAFQHYQTNLEFAMGSLGWLAVLWLWWKASRHARPMEKWFWLMWVSFNTVFGAAIDPPPRDIYGAAHVDLQPVVLVGLSLLAVGFHRLPVWAQVVVAISRIADYMLGIALHFILESVQVVAQFGADGNLTVFNPVRLSERSLLNALAKMGNGLRFLGDWCAQGAEALRVICVLMGAGAAGLFGGSILTTGRHYGNPRRHRVPTKKGVPGKSRVN